MYKIENICRIVINNGLSFITIVKQVPKITIWRMLYTLSKVLEKTSVDRLRCYLDYNCEIVEN